MQIADIVAASLLPKAEPLLAAVFGINVAYINLERFRYRRIIRKQARELIDALKKQPRFSTIDGSDGMLTLTAYANLRDEDPLGESDVEHAKHDIPTLHENEIRERIGRRFRICFSKYQDTLLCEILSYMSAILLFLSVLHSLGYTLFTKLFNEPWEMMLLSVLLLVSLFLPLLFIRIGSSVVGGMRKKANRVHKDMERTLQRIAESGLDNALHGSGSPIAA